jgi:site-specific DNA-cytosine methylase
MKNYTKANAENKAMKEQTATLLAELKSENLTVENLKAMFKEASDIEERWKNKIESLGLSLYMQADARIMYESLNVLLNYLHNLKK